jgi:hypothetical protein
MNPFCDLDNLEKDLVQYGQGRKGLEAIAWSNLDAASVLYHVTPLCNAQRILTQGLRGKRKGKIDRLDRPVIWLFADDTTGHITDMPGAVAYSLALFWLRNGDLALKKEFALLKVSLMPIERRFMLWDDVGEACSLGCYGYSTGAERVTIPAKYIELTEVRSIPAEWLTFSLMQVSGPVSTFRPNMRTR